MCRGGKKMDKTEKARGERGGGEQRKQQEREEEERTESFGIFIEGWRLM